MLLPAVLRDQILADFDQRVRQAVTLAMHRNGVVGAIADEIRLVVADDKTALLARVLPRAYEELAAAS